MKTVWGDESNRNLGEGDADGSQRFRGTRPDMSNAARDPRCPECGGPIGQTATYCMHCSADLTAQRDAADKDGNRVWDHAEARSTRPRDATAGSGRIILDAIANLSSTSTAEPEDLLAPDGLVDNTLTVVVGIIAGVVVGVIGTLVLGIVTGSGWAVAFGLVAWLGATAYLVRRRTVQEAVAKSGYAVAIVLLLVPVIALSPVLTVDGGLGERSGLFLVLLVFVAVPAAIAATIGWFASRFVPEDTSGSEG